MTGEDAFIKVLDEIIESMDGNFKEILKLKKRVHDLLDQNPEMDHQSRLTSTLLETLDESLNLNTDLSKIFIQFTVAVKHYLEENKIYHDPE